MKASHVEVVRDQRTEDGRKASRASGRGGRRRPVAPGQLPPQVLFRQEVVLNQRAFLAFIVDVVYGARGGGNLD